MTPSHTLGCDSAVSHYLAYGLEFDGGFKSAYLSGSSTRAECDANLAEPVRPGRELHGNRERPWRKR